MVMHMSVMYGDNAEQFVWYNLAMVNGVTVNICLAKF